MKFTLFLITIVSLAVISCSKNSYTTKPQITIESINTLIPYDGQLDAKLKFTDKQGDLGEGSITAVRIRLNQHPPNDSLADTYVYTIPDFPNKSLGQLEFTLPANSFHEQTTENDTVQIKFSVIDRAGNKSDTILSPVIVALYQ